MLPVDHNCEINVKQEEIYFLPDRRWCHKLRVLLRRAFMASQKSPSARRYLRTHSAIIREKRRHFRSFTNIIHPFSLFRHWWNLLMTSTMIVMMLFIPYQAAFQMNENSSSWTIGKNSFLLLCCLDITINLITGYFDPSLHRVEMNYKMIIQRYVGRGTFVPDLLGSFPTDLVFLTSWHESTVVRQLSTMIYGFRAFSVNAYITALLKTYDIDEPHIQIIDTLLWLLVLLHWLACIAWILPIIVTRQKLANGTSPYSWTNGNDLWTRENRSRYWSSWRRSVSTLTRSGFLHEEPMTPEDQYLGIFVQLLGTLIFCIIIAQVAQYFKGSNSSKLQYQEIVTQLKRCVRHRQLSKNVERRFVAYYEFRYHNHYFREIEILNCLSYHMLQEIGMHSCRKLVESVTFFNNLPISLLTRIVSLLKSEIFLANDVIVRANQPGDCMYFIATGTVAIYTNSEREVCHLEDGAHFGEIALVMPDERRVASVVAVEVCELYRLERADFAKTIHPYPMLWERIKKIATERHEKTTIINAQ